MSSEGTLYFPNVLAIQLVDEDSNVPVQGIAVMLTLFAQKKNDYHMIPDLSDSQGWIHIQREWVEKQMKIERNLFIMDYTSSLAECDENVDLKVMSEDEISRAISAIQMYREVLGDSVVGPRDLENASNDQFQPQRTTISLNIPKETSREVLIKLGNESARAP